MIYVLLCIFLYQVIYYDWITIISHREQELGTTNMLYSPEKKKKVAVKQVQ